MRAISLVFAKLERDNITANWGSHTRNAIDEGRAVGAIPIGYRRERNGRERKDGIRAFGPLSVDESARDAIWRAFDVSGAYGLEAAHEYLREAFPERRWTITLAQELLANRLYVGELSHAGYMRQFEHLRIVSDVEFDRAQHRRVVNERQSRHADFPLAGIATCASCGRGLVASVRQNAARRYRCTNRGCPGRVFPAADELERIVLDAVRADPPRLNDRETQMREGDVEAASAALTAHAMRRDAYEALGDVERWEELDARLRKGLDVARVKAMPDSVAPMPDLAREDLTPGDLRFIFERAVESCTVRPANGERGCLRKLVALKLRA
jgi:hypothetical protein